MASIWLLVVVVTMLAARSAAQETSEEAVRDWATQISRFLNDDLLGKWARTDYWDELTGWRANYSPNRDGQSAGSTRVAELAGRLEARLLAASSALLAARDRFERDWAVLDDKSLPKLQVVDAQRSNASLAACSVWRPAYNASVCLNQSAVRFPDGFDADGFEAWLAANANATSGQWDAAETARTLAVSESLTELWAASVRASQLRSGDPEIVYTFFGSRQGLTRFYPARAWPDGVGYTSLTQQWYQSGVAGPKNVVVVMDTAPAPQSHRDAAVAGVVGLLSGLTSADRFRVLWAAPDGCLTSNSECTPNNTLVAGRPENVASFVELLYGDGGEYARRCAVTAARPADYLGRAVAAAVELIERSAAESSCNRLVVVVSMGASVGAARNALEKAASVRLAFYSYGDVDADSKLVACRSLGEYGRVTAATAAQRIVDSHRLLAVQTRVDSVQWTAGAGGLAHFDVPFGLVLTASVGVYDRTLPETPLLIGAMGLDMQAAELFDIVDSVRTGMTNGCLLAIDGQAVVHPALRRPVAVHAPPYTLDVSLLEVDEFDAAVRPALLSQPVGAATLTVRRPNPNWAQTAGFVSYAGVDYVTAPTTWNWRRLVQLPFVFYTVSATAELVQPSLVATENCTARSYPTTIGLHYPDPLAPDLAPPVIDPSVRPTPIFADAALWRLAPRAYAESDVYLSIGGTVNFSLAAIAWVNELTDPAQRPAARVNPDMLRTAKEVVRALSTFGDAWRQRTADPALAELRAAVRLTKLGHDSGYLTMMPGLPGATNLPYDPAERGWYIRARARPGLACLAAPYVETLGSNAVVTTASKSLLSFGNPVAVVAVDFLYADMQRLAMASTGCRIAGVRDAGPACLVVTGSGILALADAFVETPLLTRIAAGELDPVNLFLGSVAPELSQQLIDVGWLRPVTVRNWAVELESFVYECNDTVLDTRPGGVLSGLLTECRSSRWQLTRVPATNLYLIVIGDSSGVNATACSAYVPPPARPLAVSPCQENRKGRSSVDCAASLPYSVTSPALEALRQTNEQCARAYQELYEIPHGVRIGVAALAAVVAACLLAAAAAVFVYRDRPVLRYSSPAFCLLVLFGGVVLVASTWPWYPSPLTDASCLAYLWLFVVGAELLISPIVSKNVRIWMLFRASGRLKRTEVSTPLLVACIGVSLLLDLVFLAVWTGVDPYLARPDYEVLADSDSYVVVCSCQHFYVYVGIVIASFAAKMLFCCAVAFLTRHVATSLADSKPIFLISYTVSLACLAIVPLVFLLEAFPLAVYLVRLLGTVLLTFICLAIYFVPKLYVIASGGPGSRSDDLSWLVNKIDGSSSNPTPPLKRSGGTPVSQQTSAISIANDC